MVRKKFLIAGRNLEECLYLKKAVSSFGDTHVSCWESDAILWLLENQPTKAFLVIDNPSDSVQWSELVKQLDLCYNWTVISKNNITKSDLYNEIRNDINRLLSCFPF